jgi:hypothetical protein
MTFQHRGELRADPGIAPGDRNIDPPKRRSIWPSIAVVAAASAFGGVIWYAYHQGHSASTAGGPPLVRAETGPVKVKPDNPGGQEIPYQDSTVYDRLNQNGQKPVVEKLLPPPEEPVTRAPPQQAAPPASDQASLAPPPPSQIEQQPVAPPPQAAAALPPPVDVGAPTALAPTPGAIVIQPPTVAPPKPIQVAPPTPKPAAVAKPEPAKSTPPTSIAALIAGAGSAPAAAAPKVTAGGGAYSLQLSAVRSSDAVPEEWARLKRRFPDLASLKNSTHKIDVPDKGTFYRLEAGPLDEAAAKSTCARMREQGLGCIVVKH